MATLPTDYTDARTPTGDTTELPATTTRGVNAITGQINTNTADIATLDGKMPAGAVVGTTDAQTLTHKNLTDATNTFPTFNQNTTGTAAGITGKTTPTGALVGDTDTQTLSGKTLQSPTVKDYTETVQALGTVGATKTIPALSNGTVVTATLTASTTTTFTMPTAAAGKSFVLLLKQPSSTGNGGAVFTSVKWAAAGAPTITPAAGKMDILTFISDGTNWYGSYAQGYTY